MSNFHFYKLYSKRKFVTFDVSPTLKSENGDFTSFKISLNCEENFKKERVLEKGIKNKKGIKIKEKGLKKRIKKMKNYGKKHLKLSI